MSGRPDWRRPADPEDGSAVAEFVMVTTLLLAVFLGTLQLGMSLYVRNVAISCAQEGARAGARDGATLGDGVIRSRALLAEELSDAFAQDVRARYAAVDGVGVVEVRVRAPLPVFGFLGPEGRLDVVGRAFREGQ